MPTQVMKVMPNRPAEILDYLFPGQNMCVTTAGFNGEINRAIIIRCLEFDAATEIYDAAPELAGFSPDILAEQCTPENFAESVVDERGRIITMYDVAEGSFHLILQRCFAASYN